MVTVGPRGHAGSATAGVLHPVSRRQPDLPEPVEATTLGGEHAAMTAHEKTIQTGRCMAISFLRGVDVRPARSRYSAFSVRQTRAWPVSCGRLSPTPVGHRVQSSLCAGSDLRDRIGYRRAKALLRRVEISVVVEQPAQERGGLAGPRRAREALKIAAQRGARMRAVARAPCRRPLPEAGVFGQRPARRLAR